MPINKQWVTNKFHQQSFIPNHIRQQTARGSAKERNMKTRRIINFCKAFSLILFFSVIGVTSSLSLAETNRSMHERLGGYDAISAVVDVFLTKVWEDPVAG